MTHMIPKWLWSLIAGSDDGSSEREAELRRRLERLSREVDVVQRVETSETSEGHPE